MSDIVLHISPVSGTRFHKFPDVLAGLHTGGMDGSVIFLV